MIKEGVQYKVRIDFIVQREIVHGLKYVQKTSRLGVNGKCAIFNALDIHFSFNLNIDRWSQLSKNTQILEPKSNNKL